MEAKACYNCDHYVGQRCSNPESFQHESIVDIDYSCVHHEKKEKE